MIRSLQAMVDVLCPQRRYGIWCMSFILVSHFLLSGPTWAAGVEDEEFSEALLLKPLSDRKVLASFHFRTRAPPSAGNGRHHNAFPKAVSQLVKKFNIHEMELSFTQGRWSYDKWGASDPVSSILSKPTGVELWAVFDATVSDVDATWKNLSHALAGLFCASINFLESSTAYTAPQWGFRNNSGNLRYGALPREAVCTENLTPWLKLLPCRDKAGIASILDRPSIYRGFYHSQRLRLFSSHSEGMMVEQTLTVVLQPNERNFALDYQSGSLLQPNWSVSSLFNKKLTGPCFLAKSSSIFLELERNLVSELQRLGPEESWNNSVLKLFPEPDSITRKTGSLDSSQPIIYEYNVHKYSSRKPLDLGMSWQLPLFWSCSEAPFHASRFLMGSGNERGSIAISLQAGQSTLLHQGKQGCEVPVVIFQVVPWYVKVYYHTLQLFIDGEARNFSNIVERISVSPSEDKVSPGSMELLLKLPCGMKSAILSIDFDKGFLHIDEYPPDANQGFDIPSAVVSFPGVQPRTRSKPNALEQLPSLLLSLQERSSVKLYTEVLLVPLTTPDFSMPYNVITFTCTVLALYFGSLLNVLRRRVGEEERLLSKDAPKQGLIPLVFSKLFGKLRGNSKDSLSSSRSSFLSPKLLFKIILVAMAAVIWHYFLTDV